MADQEQRILIKKDLRPAFYDDFHCLAAECRYTCCKGWRITFDKNDYLALKRQVGSSEFNTRMEGAVRRIRKDAPAGHYGEFDLSSGACPLLENGLCGLQIEKGLEALPKVCIIFPRNEIYTAGYLERSLSPACESVLELLWNLPNGVDFRSDPLPKEKWKGMSFQENESLVLYFQVIREWCVDILQDRRHSLPDRIMMMGIGLQQLANGEQDIPAWLHRVREIPEHTGGILPCVPEQRALQEYLSNCIGILIEISSKNQDFQGLRDEIAQSLGITITSDGVNRLDAIIHLEPYQEAVKRYDEHFAERSYFLENLMVALLFHLVLPRLSSPEDLWKSYMDFCSIYSIYRFMAVMSCREGAPCSKEELMRLMVFTGRGVIHNSVLQSHLHENLFKHDSATLAHMAILLCG